MSELNMAISAQGNGQVVELAGAKPLRIEPLPKEEEANWDRLVRPYETRELFHQLVWLDYLEATQGAKKVLYRLMAGSDCMGYFCGAVVKKGPFKVFATPLKGWGTNFMGPIADRDLDQQAFLRALDELARREGFDMVEMESRALSGEILAKAGYEPTEGKTYLVQLGPENPEAMWKNLDSTCRNRIRKAQKSGLVVEDADDPMMVEEFYQQYTALLARKKQPSPYSRERPRQLFDYLKKKDMLFALRIKSKSGEVVATGLFPHDERSMYFWGGASPLAFRQFCPNEFLHWSAMSLAAERGLQTYDMCGYGQFKKKFGGELVYLKRWHKCYSPVTRLARKMYQTYYGYRQRILGGLAKPAAALRQKSEASA